MRGYSELEHPLQSTFPFLEAAQYLSKGGETHLLGKEVISQARGREKNQGMGASI